MHLVHKMLADYNPSKAAGKEEHGPFTHYTFADGAKLVVRRMFKDKLFSQEWKYQKDIGLSGQVPTTLHSVGNIKVVARTYGWHGEPGYRLEAIAAVLSQKTRIEPPMLELTIPKGSTYAKVLVTRFVDGKGLNETFLRDAPSKGKTRGFARFLAKLHAGGYVHGHPKLDNLILTPHGRLSLVDAKYLEPLAEVRKPEELKNQAAAWQREIAQKHPYNATSEKEEDAVKRDLNYATWQLRPEEIPVFFKEYLAAYKKEHSKK